MQYEIETTDEFDSWLDGLADMKARRAIATRLVRAQSGLFGDSEPVGDGVSELRIHLGPGYRAYYTIIGRKLIVMLGGGDKNTQKRDIEKAKNLKRKLEL